MSTSNAPSSRRTGRSGDTLVSVMSDVASSIRELMQTSTQKVTLMMYTIRFLWSMILMNIRNSKLMLLETKQKLKKLKKL